MARTEDVTALVQEVTSTRETAEKIAKEGPSEGADVPRVLAGLIAHLAEQLERFVGGGAAPDTNSKSANEDAAAQPAQDQATDAGTEEDVTPEDAPAEPAGEESADSER